MTLCHAVGVITCFLFAVQNDSMNKTTLLVLLISLTSCVGVRKANRIQGYLFPPSSEVVDNQSPPSDQMISIQYTGCGGFLLQIDSTAILLDPYFSNVTPLWQIPFKRLEADTLEIDRFFTDSFGQQKDIDGQVKAIFVAHSHYDHLADIPSIYTRNCHADSTEIVGSKSTKHLLAGIGLDSDVFVIDTIPDYYHTSDHRIRVLPIPSEHAPHLWGMKLISAKKLNRDAFFFPRKARRFPEGENYNFLIDFLGKTGEIEFRIFSHAGAACSDGIGLPSQEILDQKSVDVLLLCVASFNQVKNYPDQIISLLQPKHIIGNHWENFFRSYRKNIEKPATVPGTNVRKFVTQLNQHLQELNLQDSISFQLPLPRTNMLFPIEHHSHH